MPFSVVVCSSVRELFKPAIPVDLLPESAEVWP